jgi:glucan phosphoethanolaminetransferase (alkaline phosphatase superfamily)
VIVKQTTLFAKQKKKLHVNQVNMLDDAVKAILSDPESGEQKQGDLSHIRVYKFKMFSQEWLLAYSYNDIHIILHTIGSHENFYRDLKRSLKS